MAVIEFRVGEVWIECYVDGEQASANHSFNEINAKHVLEGLGHTVIFPKGNFDEDSGDWIGE